MKGLFAGTTVAVAPVALAEVQISARHRREDSSGSRDRIRAAPHSIPGSLTHVRDDYRKGLDKGRSW